MLKNEQAGYWGVQAVLLLLAALAAGQLTAYAQDDAALKSEWQSRVLDAKQRLADAEGRLAEMDQKKNELTSQWGASGAALPPQEVMDEISRIEAERKAAADAVTSIRNEIDTVIPEEARKAGIPPGWIRDVQ